MSDDEWQACPGPELTNLATPGGDGTAYCPVCGWTFATMMDEPILAPHWLGPEGQVRVGKWEPPP